MVWLELSSLVHGFAPLLGGFVRLFSALLLLFLRGVSHRNPGSPALAHTHLPGENIYSYIYIYIGIDIYIYTQLSKADLLTFWFSHVGPFLVEVPKGEPFSFGSFGQLSIYIYIYMHLYIHRLVWAMERLLGARPPLIDHDVLDRTPSGRWWPSDHLSAGRPHHSPQSAGSEVSASHRNSGGALALL